MFSLPPLLSPSTFPSFPHLFRLVPLLASPLLLLSCSPPLPFSFFFSSSSPLLFFIFCLHLLLFLLLSLLFLLFLFLLLLLLFLYPLFLLLLFCFSSSSFFTYHFLSLPLSTREEVSLSGPSEEGEVAYGRLGLPAPRLLGAISGVRERPRRSGSRVPTSVT